MKIGQTFSTGMMCAVLAVGAVIYAQESRSHSEQQIATTQERRSTERELKEKYVAELATGGKLAFASVDRFEYHIGDTPIKGAPFSAQVVTENTQTLANGVHINSKSTGMLYRDSDGRTRTEEPRDGSPEIVLISDPIARVAYHLNMFQQTAVKVRYESLEVNREIEERTEREQKHVEMEHKRMAEAHSREAHVELRNEIGVAITEAQLKEDRQLKRERKVESLGTQSFEGVQAAGTRVTFTFAAGTEGNDQPFDIVAEKWYSPELQMVVMTRHNDPRSGENVYRLTSINRSEPARSLFEPPPDFRLKEERVEVWRK